jgi:hypothetical protein
MVLLFLPKLKEDDNQKCFLVQIMYHLQPKSGDCLHSLVQFQVKRTKLGFGPPATTHP